MYIYVYMQMMPWVINRLSHHHEFDGGSHMTALTRLQCGMILANLTFDPYQVYIRVLYICVHCRNYCTVLLYILSYYISVAMLCCTI